VKLSKGAWAATWNMSPTASAANQPLPMTAGITLDGIVYAATVTVSYSAKAGVGGKFKK